MPSHRPNPQRVKLHCVYSAEELATCCGVHKDIIQHWQANGLEPVSEGRPVLFDGRTVRDFLDKRNAGRKHPCSPGTLYCFKCRQPRAPALGTMAGKDDSGFKDIRLAPGSASLALCEGLADALSVQQKRAIGSWATAGTSGMRTLGVPPAVRNVVIARGNDAAVDMDAQAARLRFSADGRACRVIRPLEHFKDFDAELCGDRV